MHELDLIPAEYRQRQQIQRNCTIFICIFMVLLAAIAGLKMVLQHQTSELQIQIQSLENGKKTKLDQQQKFNELLAKERLLKKRLEIFNSLHGGPSVQQLLMAVDRVLDGDVWFNEWSLLRTAEIDMTKTMPSTSNLVIVIPEGEGGAGADKSWQLTTRMEINGQAIDHSKLSAFVSRLMKQPEINDVKLLNTSLKTYLSTQLVDFKMVVIINNQFAGKHG